MKIIPRAREGWKKVRRRNVNSQGLGRREVAWGDGKKLERAIATTFFFTEFGLKSKARDMLFEFKELGLVEKVVIPLKKDKFGRRYGFVRFLNVQDTKLLAIKLDNVVLEGRKLYAN